MIKEVKMFTVICDNCGKDANDGEDYSCWNDKSFAEDIAVEAGYLKEDDKHYCQDCFSYDEDDKLVIKSTKTTL
jgi:hypothetical protein